MPAMRDLTGCIFGKLTVLQITPVRVSGSVIWRCTCTCGNTTEVSSGNLNSGHTKSCGCLQKEHVSSAMTIHGFNKNSAYFSEYKAYLSMIGRCCNSDHAHYKDYGGRGITVCKEWLNSVHCFIKDMGAKPQKGFSLDRIDNNGNYTKSNCRWTTQKMQSNNKRNNLYIEFNGETRTAAEWSQKMGYGDTTVATRIRRGWTISAAILTPVKFR